MKPCVNWGIIGAGGIAKAFCRGCRSASNAKVVAVGSRSLGKARAFAAEWDIAASHGSYEALIRDPLVQAVYIATPHPMHAEWAIKAADAGKHLLVEKPIAVNSAEAEAIVGAARKNNVFLMEAFMYRSHPQTASLARLVANGAIGELRMIQTSFGFRAGFNANSRIWNNSLAGGGILDVGCYPVSMSRLLAGAAAGKPFADPVSVSGHGRLHPATGVDEYAAATMQFPDGVVASVATAVSVLLENVLRIFGTEGSIFVPNPWVYEREGGTNARIFVTRHGAKRAEETVCDTPETSFTIETNIASKAILAGAREPPPPSMAPADSLGNMRALDAWRQAVGLVYEMEKKA